MQQLRVDVEESDVRDGSAIVRLMHRDVDVWRPIMVEVCPGAGPLSPYQQACNRADEIRAALGLLQTFIIRSQAVCIEIQALDASDALRRVLAADEDRLHGAVRLGVEPKQVF